MKVTNCRSKPSHQSCHCWLDLPVCQVAFSSITGLAIVFNSSKGHPIVWCLIFEVDYMSLIAFAASAWPGRAMIDTYTWVQYPTSISLLHLPSCTSLPSHAIKYLDNKPGTRLRHGPAWMSSVDRLQLCELWGRGMHHSSYSILHLLQKTKLKSQMNSYKPDAKIWKARQICTRQ